MIESSLTDAQTDYFHRVLADDFLKDVAVVKQDEAVISADIAQKLGVLNVRDGKLGACIVVMQMIARPAPGEVAGGILKAIPSFMVLEDPTLNRGDGGSGIPALTIARRLVGLFYLYKAKGVMGVLTMPENVIVPAQVEGSPVAYAVTFEAQESSFDPTAKVATPKISPREGAAPQEVTLECATTGASIYYTLDGSHPYAGNESAVLYAGPVNVDAAATLRACAFKAGLIASDVNAANFS